MKLLKVVMVGVFAVGIAVYLSTASFAEKAPGTGKDTAACKGKHEARHEAKLKLLQDSATALQKTNPDLAKKLTDLANEEMNESKEKMEAGKEKKEKAEKDSAEWKAKHEAKMQLFKDAAAALQSTHPDLAKSLTEMTVAKHKMGMQKAMEEKNEKEKVGEKMERKGDK